MPDLGTATTTARVRSSTVGQRGLSPGNPCTEVSVKLVVTPVDTNPRKLPASAPVGAMSCVEEPLSESTMATLILLRLHFCRCFELGAEVGAGVHGRIKLAKRRVHDGQKVQF